MHVYLETSQRSHAMEEMAPCFLKPCAKVFIIRCVFVYLSHSMSSIFTQQPLAQIKQLFTHLEDINRLL